MVYTCNPSTGETPSSRPVSGGEKKKKKEENVVM
jgi:hypothetical protein